MSFIFSERMKELRLAKHYSQVDLAKALSVSKQSVSNWENNNILPSIEMLVAIADYFGVSTDYLLGRTDKMSLDLSGLNSTEICHIKQIISDLRKRSE